MAKSKIIEIQEKVVEALAATKISLAIRLVAEMLELANLPALTSKLDNIRETYRYMLHYLMEGTPDAGRREMLADISNRLLSLSDRAVRAYIGRDSSDYYYSVLRFNNLRKESLAEIIKDYGNAASELSLAEEAGSDSAEMRKRMETDLNRLFDSLFTTIGEDSEYAELTRYILSGYADFNVAAQAISAITLSMLMFYDRGKFVSLLDIYENTDDQKVAARALVGIVLAMSAHPERIRRDNKLMSRLSLWQDSIETYRRLQVVVRSIVGTRDTERVATKMRDEVIPELMKLRPELMKKLRESNGELDAAMMGDNPEWEELLDKSNLSDKLKELSDLQSDGADLMMVTFSNLKQFPFFNAAANWFLPFDPRHTALDLKEDMRGFIDMLRQAAQMVCDSDLYSLALASSRISDAQRSMMSNQLSANFDQLNEEMKSSAPKSSTPVFDTEALKVVRDLYRFFKLFRKREGFFDPFAQPLQLGKLPVVGEMMSDTDNLRLFGEFYFKRGYYSDALPLLEVLSATEHDDSTLWEKIGFCYQSAKQFGPALEAYTKASLLKAPGPWLTNKLAFVNRRLGNYAEAAEYYEKALDMDPENVALIMNAGNMLLETGDNAGALSHFYHANYLRSDNPKIMRAVAWAELLNGNFEKSADYYRRVMAIEAQASDYLNAGHAALLRGEIKEAVNYYVLSAESNPADFELAFNADIPTLVALGADDLTLRLLLDQVQQNAECRM